jgi:hypothetical protein
VIISFANVSDLAKTAEKPAKEPGASYCRWCETARIRWVFIRGGRRRPFDFLPVPREEAGDIGWVPFKAPDGVFWRPTSEVSDYKLSKVRWVATMHHCVEYEDAKLRLQQQGVWDSWARDAFLAHEAYRMRRQRRRSATRQDAFEAWQERKEEKRQQEEGEGYLAHQRQEREIRRDRFVARQRRERGAGETGENPTS